MLNPQIMQLQQEYIVGLAWSRAFLTRVWISESLSNSGLSDGLSAGVVDAESVAHREGEPSSLQKSHPRCLLVPLLPFGARSGAVPRIGVWRAFEFEPSHSYVRAVSGFWAIRSAPKGYDSTAKRTAWTYLECNNKMVRNNEGKRRTNRWFPEDRGQREYMYKGLCQGANMLASGAGPVTIISLLISAPGLRCALNKETNESCLARLASNHQEDSQKGRSNNQLKSKKGFKMPTLKGRLQKQIS